jgi:hypothetical protein
MNEHQVHLEEFTWKQVHSEWKHEAHAFYEYYCSCHKPELRFE